MAQISWFYTFPYGRKYEIGLFHSNDGHVVVYCDGEIMAVEFNVLKSRSFSFFIENKLLQVEITKEQSGEYSYMLLDNTPEPILNPPQKITQNPLALWVVILILAGFVGLLIWVFSFYRP